MRCLCVRRLLEKPLRLGMQRPRFFAEAAEDDAGEAARTARCLQHGPDRDMGGARGGKPVDAGRDGGEGNRTQIMACSKVQRAPVTAGKRRILALLAAAPDGTDHMDHTFRGEIVTLCDPGLARRARAKRRAFRRQFRPRRSVNCAAHAAAGREVAIGGIDNGVNLQRRNVSVDDFDLHAQYCSPGCLNAQCIIDALRAIDAVSHSHAGVPVGQRRKKSQAPLIAAEGLVLRRGGRAIIENVDIAVSAGEIVTLVGPNGAGKTSLVRLLLGLAAPDAGTITRAPGLTIGYVPQRFSVDATIPLSVGRFLTLTASRDDAAAAALLEEVGAGHLEGAQVSSLSGGEFQRVLLAKALMGNPQFLVLDEPVQNVDFSGESELYALIGTIRDTHGCGILLVSHNLHVVLGASDRVVCLNHHVCCSGVPDSVARHPEYERLFGAGAAKSYALYAHTHNHSHDLSGDVSED